MDDLHKKLGHKACSMLCNILLETFLIVWLSTAIGRCNTRGPYLAEKIWMYTWFGLQLIRYVSSYIVTKRTMNNMQLLL